jgi:hypothetical protein
MVPPPRIDGGRAHDVLLQVPRSSNPKGREFRIGFGEPGA